MANQNSSTKKIASVVRALNILELFNNQTSELGITEISKRLNLHKSTVSTLVLTLCERGYLDQNPINRKYHLGLKLLERAFVALNQMELNRVALPHMEALRDWCNETVNLAVLDGYEVFYIARVLSSQTLGMRSYIGKREKVLSTALGKAMLSYWSEQDLEQYLADYDFISVTEKTITDPEVFKQEAKQIRIKGYAVDNEENEIGGTCIAAPIFNSTGRVIAAISISMPTVRVSRHSITKLGKKITETVSAISSELGYGINGISVFA